MSRTCLTAVLHEKGMRWPYVWCQRGAEQVHLLSSSLDLLEAAADVNALMVQGKTPLHVAIQQCE